MMRSRRTKRNNKIVIVMNSTVKRRNHIIKRRRAFNCKPSAHDTCVSWSTTLSPIDFSRNSFVKRKTILEMLRIPPPAAYPCIRVPYEI